MVYAYLPTNVGLHKLTHKHFRDILVKSNTCFSIVVRQQESTAGTATGTLPSVTSVNQKNVEISRLNKVVW